MNHQPVICACQHRADKLLCVGRLERITIGSQPPIVDLTNGEAMFEYMSATEGDDEMLVLCANLGW